MKTLAFSLIFFYSALVMAAAPPSDESILKMMNALQLQTTLGQMVTQLDSGMKAGLQQWMKERELTPLQKAEVGQLQTRMSAVIKEEMAFEKVKDVYLQTYRATFTQEEVNGINAFYSSPAGKAMIEKIPGATQKASALLQARMGPVVQKIKTMQQEFINQQNQSR